MGGHKEDPLPSILGEEGPGDSGCLPSGVTDRGVGENQRHHSSGGPGNHGPADRGVTHIATSHRQLPSFPMPSDKQADTPHTLPCSVLLLKAWMEPNVRT